MILDDISRIIFERSTNPEPGSYVSSLMQEGADAVLKKIGEEAAEVIIAAKNSDREQIIHEVADLWFHCMVLMAAVGLKHDDIFRELEKRQARKVR